LSIVAILQDKALYKAFATFLSTHVVVVENLQCLRDIHEYRQHHPANALKKATHIIEKYIHPEVIVSIEDPDLIKEILTSKENFNVSSSQHLFDKLWTELVEVLMEYVMAFSKSDQMISAKKHSKIKLKVKKGSIARGKKNAK